MAETNSPGRTNYEIDESMVEAGAESGAALGELGFEIARRYPKFSVFIGSVATCIFIYFGAQTWDFHPVIFTLLSILVFVFSTFYLIALLIAAAFLGTVGFAIIFLLSLL